MALRRFTFAFKLLLATVLPLMLFACGAPKPPASPVETFETYVKALKKKDYTSAKILLSASTIKMHEQEAKAQNTTADDIIKRGSLVADGQTNVKYRNEKIEGDKAAIEVQNSFKNGRRSISSARTASGNSTLRRAPKTSSRILTIRTRYSTN